MNIGLYRKSLFRWRLRVSKFWLSSSLFSRTSLSQVLYSSCRLKFAVILQYNNAFCTVQYISVLSFSQIESSLHMLVCLFHINHIREKCLTRTSHSIGVALKAVLQLCTVYHLLCISLFWKELIFLHTSSFTHYPAERSHFVLRLRLISYVSHLLLYAPLMQSVVAAFSNFMQTRALIHFVQYTV